MLSVSGCPAVGQAFTVHVTQGLGGALGDFAIGAVPGAFPLFCGTLYLGPPLIGVKFIPLGPGGPCEGTRDVPFVVPADPTVAGATLRFQSGFLDFVACDSVSLSAGLEVVIGP